MMEHRLKTLPEYFCEVASGRMSFEVRRDDREPPFAPGDTLLLEEYIEGKYTGRWIQADVTLVLRNEYCKEGYCVMAVAPTGGNGLRPPTNADRIRGMSDDELCEMAWSENWPWPDFSTKQELLDWLSQPAKEE